MLGCSFWPPHILDIVTDRFQFCPFQIFKNPNEETFKSLAVAFERDLGPKRHLVLYVEKVETLKEISDKIQRPVRVVVYDTPERLAELKLTPFDGKKNGEIWQAHTIPTVKFNKMLWDLDPVQFPIQIETPVVEAEKAAPVVFSLAARTEVILRRLPVAERNELKELVFDSLIGIINDREWKEQVGKYDPTAVRELEELEELPDVQNAYYAHRMHCEYKINLAEAMQWTNAKETLTTELIEARPAKAYAYKRALPPKIQKRIDAVLSAEAPDDLTETEENKDDQKKVRGRKVKQAEALNPVKAVDEDAMPKMRKLF